MELGLGTGQRAVRMIEVAASRTPIGEVRYTGVDAFEARSAAEGPGLSLKAAHRLLKATGARIQLVPGDPFAALARTANSLGPPDLAIFSHGLEPVSLERAWFYLPRTLHAGSLVLEERCLPSGEVSLHEVPSEEVAKRATGSTDRRAA